jgi:hypothetical protein
LALVHERHVPDDIGCRDNTEAEIQLTVLTTEHTVMTAQLNATCTDLEEIKVCTKAHLQAKEDNWRSREKRLLFEMSVLKSRAGKSAESESGAPNKAQIKERDRRIAEIEEKLLSGNEVRRALHNHIQELRGNVRVYVRARPFLPTDGAVARHSFIDILPDAEILGDPYSKKSPLPSIETSPPLAISPKDTSYRILGQSRIHQRHITRNNHTRILAQ